jgi:hypothetical protein
MFRLIWLVLSLALLSVGCSDGDDDDPPLFQDLTRDPQFPGQPADEGQFASLFAYPPLNCGPSAPAQLNIRTELRVFRGRGVSDEQLRKFLGGLQRYYDHYGVRLFTRYAVINTPLTHAMVLDMRAVAQKLREQGIDLQNTSEVDPALLAAVGRAILFNVREFIEVYGKPRVNSINVLLLREMAGGSPDDPELKALARGVAGLGFSQELLLRFRSDDPAAQLYDWISPGVDFTPLAIVGTRLTEEVLDSPDVVMAHEVGHAYGLLHTLTSDNLMTQGKVACDLGLDSEQLERVRTSLLAQAHARSAESLSLTTRTVELTAAVRAALRRQRP